MPDIYVFNFIPFIKKTELWPIARQQQEKNSSFIRNDIQEFQIKYKILKRLYELKHTVILLVGDPVNVDNQGNEEIIKGEALAQKYLQILFPQNFEFKLYGYAQNILLTETFSQQAFNFRSGSIPSKKECLDSIQELTTSIPQKNEPSSPKIVFVDNDPYAINYAKKNQWITIRMEENEWINIQTDDNQSNENSLDHDACLKLLEQEIEKETNITYMNLFNQSAFKIESLEKKAVQIAENMNRTVANIMPDYFHLERQVQIYNQIHTFFISKLNYHQSSPNSSQEITIAKSSYREMLNAFAITLKKAFDDHAKACGGIYLDEQYIEYGKNDNFIKACQPYYEGIDNDIKMFCEKPFPEKMSLTEILELIQNLENEKNQTEIKLVEVSEKREQSVMNAESNLRYTIPKTVKEEKSRQNKTLPFRWFSFSPPEVKNLIEAAKVADKIAFKKFLPILNSKEQIKKHYEVAGEIDQFTPLQIVCLTGKNDEHLSFIRWLISEYSANVNQYSYQGFTPIHLAIRNGNIKIVDLLLKNGANVGAKTQEWIHPSVAAQKQRRYGSTPLHTAVHHNNVDIVRLLLHNDANVNAQDDIDGNTPLHLAVQKGSVEVVDILLNQNNIQFRIRNRNNHTALDNILELGMTNVALNLLKTFMDHGHCFDKNDKKKWMEKVRKFPDRYSFVPYLMCDFYRDYSNDWLVIKENLDQNIRFCNKSLM